MSEKIETNVVKPKISFFENDVDYVILESSPETELDNKISDLQNHMLNNNGKGQPEEEKDRIYKIAQDIWKEYAKLLRDTKYNFFLNRTQWKFLTDLILLKLEYDVNTVFFAIELTNLLGNMSSIKYSNDKEMKAFPVDATEITYIYHLISKHKVKGLTKDSYLFSQVLVKIGDISKIFNYYDAHAKNLSTDIQNWVTSFEDGVTFNLPFEEKNEAIDITVPTE